MKVHRRCGTKIQFTEVTEGYHAVCPTCDEDLFTFETEEVTPSPQPPTKAVHLYPKEAANMNEELLYSGLSPAGIQSPRSYTRSEIAAARRRGLINGKESQGLGGPLFWATGDYHPGMVRQAAKDYALLAKAIEREWGKEWK